VAIMVLPETQLPRQAHRIRTLRGGGQTTPVAEVFTLTDERNGAQWQWGRAICRRQSVASANEVFSGVADPALLPRGTW